MNAQYTFIHGWGMSRGIWEMLSEYFPLEQSHFADLGFIGKISPLHVQDDNLNIYITHSLGTLWALKNRAPDIDALIVINGFTNFTNFVDKRTLRTMQKRLRRNPEQQMQEFWQNIGIKNPLDQTLNIDKLREGLDWLINWDISKELNALNVPILSLAGAQDPLLPLTKIKQEWVDVDLEIMEEGGHILPLSHPDWCATKIKEFISERKLEK